MEFLSNPANMPFTIGLVVMVGLLVIELIGLGLSDAIDDMFDFDAPDGGSALTKALGWLEVGKVPFLIVLVAYLMAFCAAGFAIQIAMNSMTGAYLPAVIAAPFAFAVGFVPAKFLCQFIGHFFPKLETSSVSEESLVGKIGVVTTGTATEGNPAQARVTDDNGNSHYVRVEPFQAEAIAEGVEIVIVQKCGSIFKASAVDAVDSL